MEIALARWLDGARGTLLEGQPSAMLSYLCTTDSDQARWQRYAGYVHPNYSEMHGLAEFCDEMRADYVAAGSPLTKLVELVIECPMEVYPPNHVYDRTPRVCDVRIRLSVDVATECVWLSGVCGWDRANGW